MKVEYKSTRCFCNYQAYSCLVFYSVLSKFVFASSCIYSRQYTLILKALNKLNQM